MQLKAKEIAAITTAVLAFIRSQESPQQLVTETVREVYRPAPFSQWAASGRQAMMDMRKFLQLRLNR
ncbi:MAG: hypothetical protein PHW74_10950 [Desulfobacca sp.]|nr:hypothetical protein [Desulfobacca sp.]